MKYVWLNQWNPTIINYPIQLFILFHHISNSEFVRFHFQHLSPADGDGGWLGRPPRGVWRGRADIPTLRWPENWRRKWWSSESKMERSLERSLETYGNIYIVYICRLKLRLVTRKITQVIEVCWTMIQNSSGIPLNWLVWWVWWCEMWGEWRSKSSEVFRCQLLNPTQSNWNSSTRTLQILPWDLGDPISGIEEASQRWTIHLWREKWRDQTFEDTFENHTFSSSSSSSVVSEPSRTVQHWPGPGLSQFIPQWIQHVVTLRVLARCTMRHGWKQGCFQIGALLLKLNRKHKVHLRPEVQIFTSYKKGLRRDKSWLKMWFWMKKMTVLLRLQSCSHIPGLVGCRSKLLSVFWGHLKHRQKLRPKLLYWDKGQDSVATTEWLCSVQCVCSMCQPVISFVSLRSRLYVDWPPEICV